MKKLLLFGLLLSTPYLWSQWEIVGGSSSNFIPNPGFGNGQSQSLDQVLQFHPVSNEPYIFFNHSTTNVKTGPTLVKHNGTDWEYIDTQFESFAIVPDGSWGFYFRHDSNIPVVFYQNSYYESSSLVKKYRVLQLPGTIWEEIIGVDNTTIHDVYFGADNTRMVEHPSSNLPVIIGKSPQINVYGHRTLLAHFNNSKWENLGDSGFSEPGASKFDIDYDHNTNVPYVITHYQDTSTFEHIVEVQTYQGSWLTLGTTGFTPILGGDGFRIRVDSVTGNVYVMVQESYDNPNNAQTITLTVKKWDGTNWQTLGTPDELWPITALGYDLEIDPATSQPSVCLVDGNTSNQKINIRRWNGNNWVSLGEQNASVMLGEKLDLTFQPQTNNPFVISTSGQLLKFTQQTASVDETSFAKLKLYPNPASNFITISGIDLKKMTLYDINGREILNTKKHRILVNNLKSGIYILKITNTSSYEALKKIVVK